jgi:predicted transcriptional regulator
MINRSTLTSPSDLETRVANRKRELVSEIVEHKQNSSRALAAGAIDRLKAQLSELAHIVKEGVADGWANVGPGARLKLDAWMAK